MNWVLTTSHHFKKCIICFILYNLYNKSQCNAITFMKFVENVQIQTLSQGRYTKASTKQRRYVFQVQIFVSRHKIEGQHEFPSRKNEINILF
jgi:hypothetical protein